MQFANFRLHTIETAAIDPPLGEFIVTSFEVVFKVGRGEFAVDGRGRTGYPFVRVFDVFYEYHFLLGLLFLFVSCSCCERGLRDDECGDGAEKEEVETCHILMGWMHNGNGSLSRSILYNGAAIGSTNACYCNCSL